MMPTIAVHGSGGEVMVPFGKPGMFIRGKRFEVTVTSLSPNKEVPLEIRKQLIGLKFPAVLTGKQVLEQCGENFQDVTPEGSCLGYASEVIERLMGYDKPKLAAKIKALASDELDMWVFEKDTYQVVK